jgi:hypothetical protein
LITSLSLAAVAAALVQQDQTTAVAAGRAGLELEPR